MDINDYIAKVAAEIGNDWVEISKRLNTLGFNLSKHAVRSRARRLGIVQENKKEQKPKIETLKEKLLKDQIKRAETYDEVTEARFQLFLDTLVSAITPLSFEKKDYTDDRESNDEEAVCLILSDTHIGKRNKQYNIEIAIKRLDTIFSGLLKIVSIHRLAYPIRELHIFWTGDIVDGEAIYPTHQHHIDGHMVEQIFRPVESIVSQLARLSENFDNIYCHCIRGNHGRISKTAHEETNWDNIVYHVMRLATSNIANVHWNIPLGYAQVVDILGTKILQYHGHQIKMTLNLPWYGITTRISRWATTEGLGEFDAVVQGHFHTSSKLRWNTKQIFTNGTTVANDDFALEFIGLEASECQWVFGVHPRRKITWSYEIWANNR